MSLATQIKENIYLICNKQKYCILKINSTKKNWNWLDWYRLAVYVLSPVRQAQKVKRRKIQFLRLYSTENWTKHINLIVSFDGWTAVNFSQVITNLQLHLTTIYPYVFHWISVGIRSIDWIFSLDNVTFRLKSKRNSFALILLSSFVCFCFTGYIFCYSDWTFK